jgi:methylated-DNA-[protein]-cysteine S-methyltransferase
MTSLRLLRDSLPTPIGRLHLVSDEQGRLRAVGFDEEHDRMHEQLRRFEHTEDVTVTAARDPGGLRSSLAAYFEGELRMLDDLPVLPAGTPFQTSVWLALRSIPCGTTLSYAELARRVGRPAAVRAVGQANGANPIGVVLPCHRVIGANGTLTGYGGGLPRKQWLLRHERALPEQLAMA